MRTDDGSTYHSTNFSKAKTSRTKETAKRASVTKRKAVGNATAFRALDPQHVELADQVEKVIAPSRSIAAAKSGPSTVATK